MTGRYRFTLFGRPRGPWRATREEAVQDALTAGEGSRQPWRTAPTYLAVGVEIECDQPDRFERRRSRC
ncbi:MAG TPA: hypothetical protein VFL92_09500 [Sphingomonas sp.]|nr:hypothetical protein [Sphingomonas sp.]